MGAGISQDRARGIMRRMLRKIENELREAGVPCYYQKRTIFNGAEPKTAEEPSLPIPFAPSFEVSASHGHMSNGESVISTLLFIKIDPQKKCEVYDWQDLEKGLRRVKEFFAVHATAGPVA